MRPIDELRESVLLVLPTYSPSTRKLVLSVFESFEADHPECASCDEWLCYNGLCVIREPKRPDVRVHGKATT